MASSPPLTPLLFLLLLLFSPSLSLPSHNRSIELPPHPLTFNAASSSTSPCHHFTRSPPPNKTSIPSSSPLKLHLTHRDARSPSVTRTASLAASANRDLSRFHKITRPTNHQNTAPPMQFSLGRKGATQEQQPELAGRIMATLESGVSLDSGEYLMDVYIGTPPRHFSLILDTGSDLNWIQCLPCKDCYNQHGPFYDPTSSSSYRNVTCADPRCRLVSPPDPPRRCGAPPQPCPYFYWYGDQSNTTGDLALETFTVNLTAADGTSPESRMVEEVIFGCGHRNRGLFHGAAGLLGLGRGPLSFSSQLRSLYGHTFSYCLVDRNSDLSVSSKLIFGEDPILIDHPELNYTSFVPVRNDNPANTFYYVAVKGVAVGGELLGVPAEMWKLSADGAGGTIIDSGTTLSYFVDPAYQVIREAFVRKIKYPVVLDFPILNPCYNVSGVEELVLPEFAIHFADGAVWKFPKENYFIRLEPEEIMCLAILGTPRSSLSILGNYQQQNFHIMYDTKNSRLGFAPMRCAEV